MKCSKNHYKTITDFRQSRTELTPHKITIPFTLPLNVHAKKSKKIQEIKVELIRPVSSKIQ